MKTTRLPALLSRDFFRIDPNEIENVQVVLRMVEGRVVYEARERE